MNEGFNAITFSKIAVLRLLQQYTCINNVPAYIDQTMSGILKVHLRYSRQKIVVLPTLSEINNQIVK
jgi:hypothetical protein